MSDDRPPDPHAADPDAHDARDEEVAALLAVPALDDVTRRRLVRRAVDSRPTAGRLRPALAAGLAAASVVVAVVVGVAVLRDGSDDTPTAQRPPPTRAAPETDRGAPVSPPLPQLGDVSDPADLAARTRASGDGAAEAPLAAAGPACAAELAAEGITGPTPVGEGTVDGRPVLVVTATDASGRPVALALRADHCTRLRTARL